MVNIGQAIKDRLVSARRSKFIYGEIGLIVLAMSLSMISMVHNEKINVGNNVEAEYSEFNCGLDNNEFYIEPINVKTELGEYDGYIKLDIDSKNIVTLDNYNNFTFMTYKNEVEKSMTELLITDKLPDELNTKGLEQPKTGGKVKVVTEASSLKGMKKITGGYVYKAITAEVLEDVSKFSTSIDSIVDNISYNTHTDDRDVILNIDGIGRLSLNSLSVFKDSPGIYYGKDKILRLYNYKDDEAYIWITHINNTLLMNTVGNLEITEYNNVYLDKDYNSKDKMGYKTLAIMTNSGMYSIKFGDNAPDGLEDEFLQAIQISEEDDKIELPYKINSIE